MSLYRKQCLMKKNNFKIIYLRCVKSTAFDLRKYQIKLQFRFFDKNIALQIMKCPFILCCSSRRAVPITTHANFRIYYARSIFLWNRGSRRMTLVEFLKIEEKHLIEIYYINKDGGEKTLL